MRSAKFKRIGVRRAKIADLHAILEIYAKTLDDGRALDKLKAERVWRKIRHYPNYKVYVACRDRKIIGAFELLIMDNLGHQGAPSGILEDVAVHPDWQGHGVGKSMMHFALAQCKKAGCYKLSLSSNTKRISAHRFYRSLKFKRHGFSFVTQM